MTQSNPRKEHSDHDHPSRKTLKGSLSALFLLIGVPYAMSQSQPSAEEMVNALNGVFGHHAHKRGSHAKGFFVSGTFTPTKAGKHFSLSPLFQGGTIPVTARFSIGGGNPQASDKSRSVRGLAVRFHLENKELLDLVMISAPTFFASTPSQFIEFLKVRTADPITGKKNPAKINAFNQANPNVQPHLQYLKQTPPPASYATTPYFSTHAFFFLKANQKKQAARWILEPVGGFVGLTEKEEAQGPKNFLAQELSKRLKEGAAVWNIYLQIPKDDDSLVDPSAVWPDSRIKIKVGQLTIDSLVEKTADEDRKAMPFDPNRLPSGISATADPILAIRSPAYAVSFGRRAK